MRLRTRLAALTIGAAAAVTPLVGIPAASAAPASGGATAAESESGEELQYVGWWYDQAGCMNAGWNGYAVGLWHPDWICWHSPNGTWELWMNPVF